MTSLPCTWTPQSRCFSLCLLDKEMSGLMSCRCPHGVLLPIPQSPLCLGNAFLSNLKSLLLLFYTNPACFTSSPHCSAPVPAVEQIHFIRAEPFLVITVRAFLCVGSETLGAREAFGVSWCCNLACPGNLARLTLPCGDWEKNRWQQVGGGRQMVPCHPVWKALTSTQALWRSRSDAWTLWKARPWTVNKYAMLWENNFKLSFQMHCVTLTAEGCALWGSCTFVPQNWIFFILLWIVQEWHLGVNELDTVP